MQVIRHRKLWMFLGLCFLAGGLTSWTADAAARRVAPLPDTSDSDLLLCPQLLEHARLKIAWQQTLPVKRGETFATATLLDGRLYLRSDHNYLWSLDAGQGDVIFSRSIAPRGIPILGLVSHGNSLISVVGNRLMEVRADTGTEERVSNLELSIVAPPVRNSDFLYVAGANRRLHVFRADDLVRLFQAAPDNDSLITTVLADENMVVCGTSAGNLFAMAADAPKRLWQFNAAGAVAGPVVRDGYSFYFASKDTNVYRIDMVDTTEANMVWRFRTEAVLDRAPRVTAGFVYQYAVGRGLTAIDKQTGQAVWSLPEGLDLLAEAGNRAYIITTVRTLIAMDNTTGRRLYSVNCAPVTGHVANTTNPRIYLTDVVGRVTCLEPIR
jgi:outer membrane protein assembly factor BamB